jgi:uncharacterized RDD family membrane protein YckC
MSDAAGNGRGEWEGWPPDPLDAPELYNDITSRRIFAFFIDLMILAMITLVVHMALIMLTVASFGLLAPLHGLLAPPIIGLAYHILQVGSPVAATLGMRLMGLRTWSVNGGRPTGLQAIIHGICYYGSMAVTGGLIALVALFNRRRQTLHDMLAGIVMLRET